MNLLLILLMLTVSMLPLWAQNESGSRQFAVIQGQAISEEQVREAAAADLETVELRRAQAEASYVRDRYAALERTLQRMVEERLMSLEAGKRGVTEAQVFQAEIEENVVLPSDEDIRDFYEANRARIPAPLEEAYEQIRRYLLDERREELYGELIARLKREYDVETYLDPLRIELATEGFPARGPASAPVTLVEFSDFECPFCKNLVPALKEVEQNYGDRVRIIYRHFPLTSIHPHAQKAAEASMCANDQQKFWELHDAMFDDQQNLTVSDLKAKAAQLQMDVALFDSCLDSGMHAEAVIQDIRDGNKAGVTGTPAMFINGRFISGAVPYAEIRKIIDEELQRSPRAN